MSEQVLVHLVPPRRVVASVEFLGLKQASHASIHFVFPVLHGDWVLLKSVMEVLNPLSVQWPPSFRTNPAFVTHQFSHRFMHHSGLTNQSQPIRFSACTASPANVEVVSQQHRLRRGSRRYPLSWRCSQSPSCRVVAHCSTLVRVRASWLCCLR